MSPIGIDHVTVKSLAKKHQLIAIAAVGASKEKDYEFFSAWLKEGRHAEMRYLEKNLNLREYPFTLAEGSQTALVVGLSYAHLSARHQKVPQSTPKAASYALLPDYHHLLKTKAQEFGKELVSDFPDVGRPLRVCVDSAPVLERSMAGKENSEGFIGKNTMYIHREYGSFLLLGIIFFEGSWSFVGNEKKVTSEAEKPHPCGTCRRCQVHCPTGALDKDFVIDARKCLSYWTIEHRGLIPKEYWPHLAKYWYGCDICQDVCPHNRRVILDPELSQENLSTWKAPDLWDVATMNQKEYERMFGGFPFTRAKIYGLKRNALIAMYVTGHKKFDEAAKAALSDDYEVVRDTARSLLGRVEDC